MCCRSSRENGERESELSLRSAEARIGGTVRDKGALSEPRITARSSRSVFTAKTLQGATKEEALNVCKMTRCVGMASRLCIMTMTTTTTTTTTTTMISMTRYRGIGGGGTGVEGEIKDDISLRYVGIKGNVFSVLFLAIL